MHNPLNILTRKFIIYIILFLIGSGVIYFVYVFYDSPVSKADLILYQKAYNTLPGKHKSDVIKLMGNPDRNYYIESGKKERLAFFLCREKNPYSGIDSIWIFVDIDINTDIVCSVSMGSD